jgi:hypothetical protein
MTNSNISQAKQTNLLKKYIKQRFGVSVRIKTEHYSMGCSINIDWTLGCSKKDIEKICNRLQYGDFDGMTDMYNYSDDAQTGLTIDGVNLNTFKYVFVQRYVPETIGFQLAKAISDKYSYQGVHKCETMEDYRKNFSDRFGSAWNWQDMAYRQTAKLNFITQDESEIKIIEAYKDEKISDCWDDIHFIYEVGGKRYETSNYKQSEPEIKKESQAERNDIKVVDYSDKALAVQGQTFEIKDQLKELGGKFNKHLKGGPGWIFPKYKADAINDVIINYHLQTK